MLTPIMNRNNATRVFASCDVVIIESKEFVDEMCQHLLLLY